MHSMDWLGGGWFMMGFWWIILVVGFVFAVFWFKSQIPGSSETALDILKKRYAAGEISKKEFDEKKKELV